MFQKKGWRPSLLSLLQLHGLWSSLRHLRLPACGYQGTTSGMGNAAALAPPVFPGSASVEHWGLLHDLSNCCWVFCCLEPKRRMKMLGQYAGTQTSFLVSEEHSWHEKSILKNQGRGGRADLPLSILWTTPWCPPTTPTGRHDIHMLCRLLAMLSPSRSASLEQPSPAVRSTGQSAWTQPRNHLSSLLTPYAVGDTARSPPICLVPRAAFFPKSPNWKSDYLDWSQTSVKSKSRVFSSGWILTSVDFSSLNMG